MGVPIFAPHVEDYLRPYYDGLAAGELRLSADPDTGAWLWYPPEVIPGKPGKALVWRTVPGEGVVHSFTTIVRSLLPGDHSAEVPFTVVLVEIDAAPGVRVPGLYVDAGEASAACGQRVTLKPVKAGDWTVAGFTPIA